MKKSKPNPRCRNCGDETTFATSGDRTPDYERESLGWCRRCWKVASRQHGDGWPKFYRQLLASKLQQTASDTGSTLALALVCALTISRLLGVWGEAVCI